MTTAEVERLGKRLDRHARAIRELRKEQQVANSMLHRIATAIEGMRKECRLCRDDCPDGRNMD